jgi:hypothetical protein
MKIKFIKRKTKKPENGISVLRQAYKRGKKLPRLKLG